MGWQKPPETARKAEGRGENYTAQVLNEQDHPVNCGGHRAAKSHPGSRLTLSHWPLPSRCRDHQDPWENQRHCGNPRVPHCGKKQLPSRSGGAKSKFRDKPANQSVTWVAHTGQLMPGGPTQTPAGMRQPKIPLEATLLPQGPGVAWAPWLGSSKPPISGRNPQLAPPFFVPCSLFS